MQLLRVRVDAGKLAAALGLENLDPLALSCEKASGALRHVDIGGASASVALSPVAS